MAIQKYNSCTKHFYDKINNKNNTKTIKNVNTSGNISRNTSSNSKTNIFKNISNHISIISKYNNPIKYLNNKSIYSKNFEEMILNLQKTYYIDNISDIDNNIGSDIGIDIGSDIINTNNTINWIANTNSYKVGESFYTGIPPTIDTPNYDDDYIFLVNKNDLIIQPYLKRKGMPYEKFLILAMSAYMPLNGIMLDIGTNIGTVAVPMSRANKGAVVFAFEPFRQNYTIMLENIRRNNAYNIVPLPVAVGDKPRNSVSLSSSILKIDADKTAHRVLIPDNYNYNDKDKNKDKDKEKDKEFNFGAIQLGVGGNKVRMVSIDSLQLNFDVMKVDIEGAEPLAFYGAKESIKRCMPVIAFEHNANQVTQDMRDSLNISDSVADVNILKYCYSLGYREIYEIPGDNFMLIPPNRKFAPNNNPLWKYGQVSHKFKQFNPSDLDGYKLYKYLMPSW